MQLLPHCAVVARPRHRVVQLLRFLLAPALYQAAQEVEGKLLALRLHLYRLLEALLGVGEVVELAQAHSEQVEEGAISVYPQGRTDVDLGWEVLAFPDEGEGDVGVDVPAEGVEE